MFLLDVHFLSVFTLYIRKFSLEFQKQNTLVNHQVQTLEALHQSLNFSLDALPPYVQEEFKAFFQYMDSIVFVNEDRRPTRAASANVEGTLEERIQGRKMRYDKFIKGVRNEASLFRTHTIQVKLRGGHELLDNSKKGQH